MTGLLRRWFLMLPPPGLSPELYLHSKANCLCPRHDDGKQWSLDTECSTQATGWQVVLYSASIEDEAFLLWKTSGIDLKTGSKMTHYDLEMRKYDSLFWQILWFGMDQIWLITTWKWRKYDLLWFGMEKIWFIMTNVLMQIWPDPGSIMTHIWNWFKWGKNELIVFQLVIMSSAMRS